LNAFGVSMATPFEWLRRFSLRVSMAAPFLASLFQWLRCLTSLRALPFYAFGVSKFVACRLKAF
jgi:hypothetical protein